MFAHKKSKEDCMQELSDTLYDKLFNKMKERAFSDAEIAKIILVDCLEFKIEDSKFTEKSYPHPELIKIFEYTRTRFNTSTVQIDSHPEFSTPMDFAVYLATLNELKIDTAKLTVTDLYQAFMALWFSNEYIKLMHANTLAGVDHDVIPDFHFAAESLAKLQNEEKEIKDPIKKIAAASPLASADDVARSVNACPLRKTKTGTFVFIHPKIQDYLMTKVIFDSLTHDSPRPPSPGLRKTS